MTDQEKECAALDGVFNGMTATAGDNTYKVEGTYMDANGCLKTYGKGYDESFICDTEYG